MLVEGIDYYINEDGNWVFTRQHHLKEAIAVVTIASTAHGKTSN